MKCKTHLPWMVSDEAAAKSTLVPNIKAVVYWKKIVSGKGIIGKVCGTTQEEAEQIAMYLCDMHNNHLQRSRL
jgi:hypothetical protein